MSKAKQVEKDELSQAYTEPARIPRATPARLTGAEFARRRHYYHGTAGSPLEQYLQPTFWLSVARNIKPLDLIEVVGENGDFRAELIVRSVGDQSVDVALLSYVKFGLASAPGQKSPIGGLRVVYGGSHSRWTDRDGTDRVLVEFLQDERTATQWAESHAEVLANSARAGGS